MPVEIKTTKKEAAINEKEVLAESGDQAEVSDSVETHEAPVDEAQVKAEAKLAEEKRDAYGKGGVFRSIGGGKRERVK